MANRKTTTIVSISTIILVGTALFLVFIQNSSLDSATPDALSHQNPGGDIEKLSESSSLPVAVFRKDKFSRLEEIHASWLPDTENSREAEARIRKGIDEFAESHGGSPKIVDLDCRGDTLCKLVIDHLTRDSSYSNVAAMQRNEVFEWDGATESGSTNQPTQQRLFLIDKSLTFDGWNLVDAKRKVLGNRSKR